MALSLIPLIPFVVNAMVATAVATTTAALLPIPQGRQITQNQRDAALAAQARVQAAMEALSHGLEGGMIATLAIFVTEAEVALAATTLGHLWSPVFALAQAAAPRLNTFVVEFGQVQQDPQVDITSVQQFVQAWTAYITAMNQ